MGEAKRKRLLGQNLGSQRKDLEHAVAQVSHALLRLFTAASSRLGTDCYAHAEIGRALLRDFGFEFNTRVGFAAWRVGSGDGDVLSHVPGVQSYVPENAVGLAYHAWLEYEDWLIDFTTYQFLHKAALLDASDGGETQVDWRPEYLLLSRSQVKSYRAVAQALTAGVAYYEGDAALTTKLASGYSLDADEVELARKIMQNPEVKVFGPIMGN